MKYNKNTSTICIKLNKFLLRVAEKAQISSKNKFKKRKKSKKLQERKKKEINIKELQKKCNLVSKDHGKNANYHVKIMKKAVFFKVPWGKYIISVKESWEKSDFLSKDCGKHDSCLRIAEQLQI